MYLIEVNDELVGGGQLYNTIAGVKAELEEWGMGETVEILDEEADEDDVRITVSADKFISMATDCLQTVYSTWAIEMGDDYAEIEILTATPAQD